MIKAKGFGLVYLPVVAAFVILLFSTRRIACDSNSRVECPASPTLGCAREKADICTMREHGWHILGMISSPVTRKSVNWETWASKKLVFSSRSLNEPPKLDLSFPKQFDNSFRKIDKELTSVSETTPQPSSPIEIGSLEAMQHILTDVRFNDLAAHHIRTLNLQSSQTLSRMLDWQLREIPEFPCSAISIKAVWWPIKEDGLTIMPVWDGIPVRSIEDGVPRHRRRGGCGNDFSRWDRFVAIDSTELGLYGPSATIQMPMWNLVEPINPPIIVVPVLPLPKLYFRTILEDDLLGSDKEILKKSFELIVKRAPRAGDKLALVGFHVATKEVPDWVWITYWWHDSPSEGPFASQRPKELPSPWNNYLMDITLSADTPRTIDGKEKIIFNPWLEGGFAKGLQSNCIACHQRAAFAHADMVPTPNEVSQIVTRGRIPLSDAYFANRLRVDYLWSLALSPP